MIKKLSWSDKYLLSLKEEFTLKEIAQLRDVGLSSASRIRQEAINYCLKNDIPIVSRFVPSIAVLEVTKKGIDYYYDKMILERKALPQGV